MATSGDSLSVRLNNALNLPLQYRCDELANIFEEFGNKELQMILPQLLESLFGLTDQMGWGLRTIYHNMQPCEFDILFRFLHPHGAMFRLCYKLLTDFYAKYEFPLTYLPGKVRKQIEDGMVPPFYSNKVQLDPQTRVPISLTLNSFEFYIFHFAYHLVNPWLQRVMDHGSWSLWETVYKHLAEEYLVHFLPSDGSSVLPYAGCYIYPKSSVSFQAVSRPARSPTLFRQSVVLKQGSTSSSLHSSPSLPQQSSLVEIWRSESVIQVFIDFWLSYGERDMSYLGTATPSRHYYPTVASSSYFHSQVQPQPNFALCQCPCYLHIQMQPQPNMALRHYPDLLPSVEHIRVVRNLVKHLHYFANSIIGDLSAMDELKRIILPSSQAKLYGFMRHTIHHWPLDSSFRLILETWLSYIQPWRYTDWQHRNMRSPTGRDNDEHTRTVDRQWINFIAENVLSYTVIFRQLLPRFKRLDLTTPKNAHMLFRVTKVFSQPNLNTMIKEVEHCLDGVSGAHLSNDSVSSSSPETSHQGHKWSALVRQQVLELEGPGYQYKPLFGSETVSQVFQFMLLIQRAIETAHNLQLHLETVLRNRSSSFFASLKNFFSSQSDSDEYSLEERRKVSAYLGTCLCYVSNIFEIDSARLPNVSSANDHDAFNSCNTLSSRHGTSGLLEGENTSMEASPFRSLGSTSVSPLLASRDWKERRKCIKYEGDPDLQPIKSTENAFLVRLLHQITSKLNEMYTLEMCHLYEQRGLLGCIARQLLCPPMITRAYDKNSTSEYAPRVEMVLPPRLSLRSFASHRTIAYLLVGMGLAWVFGYGPAAFIFILLFLCLFCMLLKAVLEPWFGSTHRSVTVDALPSPINQSDMSFSEF
ncbi:Sphingomyelin phosphodiesterase 4 [Zootermopsis nevadensis]|uniref:Sphingomyelin phosphodiesterase 4 n=3 Tax=Zootermopsis nevadensis TaxID=136037 RepID=A0A067RMT8_ZOONE|nr:Sphingomyelin phosphodiesterase 4 [Zootermopsis nevadensis]